LSMYLKQIEQLIVLQKVDDEIIILEKELESLPKELSELEENNALIKQQLDNAKDRAEVLSHQNKVLSEEIEGNEEKIQKSKDKMMLAGNTREYQAVVREMDNLEKINRAREEDKVNLIGEMEEQNQVVIRLEEQFATSQKEVEEFAATLKKRTTSTKKRLNKLLKERNAACEVIPPRILGRYEFIRARISHPVIVPVEESVCTGCHIMIPPQEYNELQKGEQILSCPNCQRLIYWGKKFSPETAEDDK